MSKKIIVVTAFGCPPCRILKAELLRHDIDFKEIDESEIEDYDIEPNGVPTTLMIEESNTRTVREVLYGYSRKILDEIIEFWRS